MTHPLLTIRSALKRCYAHEMAGVLSRWQLTGMELDVLLFLGNNPDCDTASDMVQLRQLTRKYNALLIIDDFVDLAIAVDADGVHVGQDDLPPQVVRKLLGNDKIIGLSTHNPQQLEQANMIKDIIDYIGTGPVYATQTKPGAKAAGLDYISCASEHSQLPFVAIGGLKAHNVAEVAKRGASCIAVVSEITGAADIQKKIQEIVKNFQTSR